MLTAVFGAGLLACLLVALFAPQIQIFNQAVLEHSPKFVQQFFNTRLMSLGGHVNRTETFWVNYQRIGSLLFAVVFAALLVRQLLVPK